MMHHLNTLFSLLVYLSVPTTMAQSVTETRQTFIPAPAFVLTPPVSATPDDLKAGKLAFTIENLSVTPINVLLEGTFTATGATTVAKIDPREIVLESRESAEYPIEGSGSGNVVVTASTVGGGYKTSSKVTIKPAPLVGTSSLALLKMQDSTAFTGPDLRNNRLPLKSTVSFPCSGIRVGWVSGDQGSAPIMAMPYFTPTASNCPNTEKVDVSQLLLKVENVEKSPTLPSGNYSGTLNLDYDGGGEKDQVKLELLKTWPWWLAVVPIVLGVATGFAYRWWSGAAGAVQADRTEAATYRVAALLQIQELLKSQPLKQIAGKLDAEFRKNVDTEHTNIIAALNAERGLTRDSEKAKLMAARLAVFGSTPGNYEGLVTALTTLSGSKISTPHLQNKVSELLNQPAPTVAELSAARLKAESLLALVPIWNELETTVQTVLHDLDLTQNQFLSAYRQITTVSVATLALQVAQDLRDSTVAAAQGRRGLDSAEPTLATTAEIQQAVRRALDTLVAAKVNLPLLLPPVKVVHNVNPAQQVVKTAQQVAMLSTGKTGVLLTPVQQAQLVLRHQRAMLFSMNIIIALITLLIALVSGLGELYWAKPFGWIQAFQAFAWGFGLKVGLDNLYMALDHFIFNTNRRLLPSPA